MNTPIIVTEADMRRLERLVDPSSSVLASDSTRIEALDHELGRAHIVAPEAVANDVITMNSRVRVRDLDRNETHIYTLVYPSEADSSRGRISVLAPIGTALLGCRSGQRVQFPAPGGLRRLEIEAIEFQPESDSMLRSSA